MTDQAEKEAVDLLQRAYFDEVRDWATEYDKRIADGEWEDREAFMEALEQDIDGCQRVIYTYRARVGLLCSNNPDAYFEEIGDADGVCSKDGINYSQLMYFAFRADILDRMESDIDDDDTFDSDEDEDDEDED